MTVLLERPDALSANLLVGRDPDVVEHAVDEHLDWRALVVAFEEAAGYLPEIRKQAKAHGYRPPIVADREAGRGMNSTSLLVHQDAPVHASGVAEVMTAWFGPRLGIRWPGRGIPWAVTDIGEQRTLVAAIHGPTGRLGANKRAWKRYLRRLRRMARKLARRHRATAILFLGDWNCEAGDTDRTSVRRLLAARIGAHIVRADTPIDYAVVRGLRLVGRKGPKYGSDHPSVRFYRKAA